MTGAIAAAWARGLPFRDALVLGAAAGSGNFLRRGLGSGRCETVQELARRVSVRPLARPGPERSARARRRPAGGAAPTTAV